MGPGRPKKALLASITPIKETSQYKAEKGNLFNVATPGRGKFNSVCPKPVLAVEHKV